MRRRSSENNNYFYLYYKAGNQDRENKTKSNIGPQSITETTL